MATVQITITAQVGDGFTPHEAAAEMLFDFGIGNPENGEECINMRGQSYEIIDFQSNIVGPVSVKLNHHLTNMGVEPK